MGNAVRAVVDCARLEDLATLAKSEKIALLGIEEKKTGSLTLRVEGKEYLVTRCAERGIHVCRLGIDDLPRSKRFRQAITEFFTHQVFDFFRLRGVGTRSRRIAKIVEGWTRFQDGQEQAKGPPLFGSPTVTVQGPGKQKTVSQADHVGDYLENHSLARIAEIKLGDQSAPLDDLDRQCLQQNAARMIPQASTPVPANPTPALDDAACEAELRSLFSQADNGKDRSAFDSLLSRLQSIAGAAQRHPDADPGSEHIRRARLLLLGHAISTASSPGPGAMTPTPADAEALLDALTTGNLLQTHGDNSKAARHCWHAARQLARCELGFQLLCDLAEPPADLPGPAVTQWQAALRIYMQVTAHLIAAHETSLATLPSGSESATSTRAQLQAALHALSGDPLGAAQHAAGVLANVQQPHQYRLAYRALIGAVKLMRIRAVADTAWLKEQRIALKQGTATAADVLDRDEVMALALWRNGFHDDLDDGALAVFQRCLNMFVMEWLPREERDPTTGEVRHRVAHDSPVVLAFNEPITQGATRRTITQQCEDHQAAMGQMTRVLVLRMKEAAGLPLREHEELLGEVLELREAIGKAGLAADVMEAVEAEIEGVLTTLDSVARVFDVQGSGIACTLRDLDRLAKELGLWLPNGWAYLDDIRDSIETIRSRCLRFGIAGGPITNLSEMDSGAAINEKNIAYAVHAILLGHWLVCTELGARFHPYRITELERNAVISELADIIDVETYRPAIDDVLNDIDEIDLQLLDSWATEAGLLSDKNKPDASGQRFRRHRETVAMIRVGRDKVDAGVHLPEVPRSRRDFQAIAEHLVDTNLGTGVRSSVTRNNGAEVGITVDPGAIMTLVAPAPSVSFSFAYQHTAGTTKNFGLIGSSVGGQTITVSETVAERDRARAGIGIKTPAAIKIGIDGGLAEAESLEYGMVLRIPPTPGSRDWAVPARHVTKVVFGEKLAEKLSKPPRKFSDAVTAATRGTAPDFNVRGLRELCWQCFAPLISGKLALNVFESAIESHTFTAGVSASVGADGGSIPVGVSLNARIGTERDRILRQSRVDHTGSTRVEAHGLGSASRHVAAIRLLASFLPMTLTDHLDTEFSSGAVAGLSVTFAERGVQHFLRRETFDGVTLPSYAWDIVFRDAQQLVAHLNTAKVRADWDAFNSAQPRDRATWTLDERCQTILHHARHSNQSYMVRRHLRPAKLLEFNAMVALLEGLVNAAVPFDKLPSRYDLLRQCLLLLENDDNYELGGFGSIAGDHVETQTGIEGNATLTEVRAVSVPAEQLWFSARIPAAAHQAPGGDKPIGPGPAPLTTAEQVGKAAELEPLPDRSFRRHRASADQR
ncbi:hypothetical protein L602_000100001540 [Cupriavidus gilardii J11]|uniref:Uncharacterized protein n=1 Tax=Cupriavidus gilardii J11 TaxID=936133 RepID=A0A562BVK8_9BURK|nr:hypothetical protein [Cupriavidus gilardii]TWG89264.1 hypothetical protein L602_000100001540 [Cupriavidus gilardii J11]